MGLSILGSTVGCGCYMPPVPKQAMKSNYDFRDLLRRVACHMSKGEDLEENEEQCLLKLGADCAAYLNTKAYESASYAQVVSTLVDIIKNFGFPQVISFAFQVCVSSNVVGFFNIHDGFSQVCESCPVRTPKDRLLLSVGAEVYKVCQERDALLPFLIKNNPSLPLVHNQKIKISAATGGQILIFRTST